MGQPGMPWCHFDRWFALVTVTDLGGDLDALEEILAAALGSSQHSRGDIEAKLSHLADLRTRMTVAGIDPATLTAFEMPDKATVAKARRKVFDQDLDRRAMTPAMIDTPAARLERRARYGHWDTFPVDPARWYQTLAGRQPPTFLPPDRTRSVTRQLRQRLARLDGPRRPVADRLALYRAFHTESKSPTEATTRTPTSANCASTPSAPT